MSKLRMGAALAVLACSLVASTTVFGSSSPPAKVSQSVTLTLQASNIHQKPTDNMIAGYRKSNPGTTFKTTYAPGSVVLETLLKTQISAGNPSDITYINPGSAQLGMNTFAGAGALADLSKEPWVKKLPASLRSAATYKGKVYALPFSSYNTGAVYNKTLFSRAGIKVPTTMNQLIAHCKTIRQKLPDVTPVTIPFGDFASGTAGFIGVMTAFVDPKFNSLKSKRKTSFATDKGWQATFTALNKMKAANCFSPGAAGATFAQSNRDITTGRAAMMFYVNASLGQQRTAAEAAGAGELGFFVIPGNDAKKRRMPVAAIMWAIPSKSNVAEAKKFLRYMALPANNSGHNKISGGISNGNLAKGKLPAGNEEAGKVAKKKGGTIPAWYLQWPNPAASTYEGREFQAWFTGQSPADGSKMRKGLDYLWANPSAVNPPN